MKTLKLSVKLFERYEHLYKVDGYYGLLALFALAQTAEESGLPALIDKANNLLSEYPDKIVHPHYNFINYRVGGLGKAWAVMKGLLDNKQEIIEYAEQTLSAPADEDGILCWPSCPEEQRVWIDVVYAITPYMLYTGLAAGNNSYIDFAVDQCEKMYLLLLDETNGLLHQSRGFMPDRSAISHDHWSRGNGWGYIGLTELVQFLPMTHPKRRAIETYFINLSKALLPHQTEKGLWRQEIPLKYSWVESSGTALIAYGIGVGLRMGLLDDKEFRLPFEQAINGLCKYFIGAGFSTKMCCQGCLCPGTGTKKGTVEAYLTDVFPCQDDVHSYGSFMLALVEAHRNGITDVELNI